jgi:hypothetical protein
MRSRAAAWRLRADCSLARPPYLGGLAHRGASSAVGDRSELWVTYQTASAFALRASNSDCEMVPLSSIALAWAIWSVGLAELATCLM